MTRNMQKDVANIVIIVAHEWFDGIQAVCMDHIKHVDHQEVKREWNIESGRLQGIAGRCRGWGASLALASPKNLPPYVLRHIFTGFKCIPKIFQARRLSSRCGGIT